MEETRAEIIVNGLVQGVGFRYYVIRKAAMLGLTGYTQNLYTGEVLTIAEGPKEKLIELFELLKIGPASAHVKNANIIWKEPTGEFKTFEVRY